MASRASLVMVLSWLFHVEWNSDDIVLFALSAFSDRLPLRNDVFDVLVAQHEAIPLDNSEKGITVIASPFPLHLSTSQFHRFQAVGLRAKIFERQFSLP